MQAHRPPSRVPAVAGGMRAPAAAPRGSDTDQPSTVGEVTLFGHSGANHALIPRRLPAPAGLGPYENGRWTWENVGSGP